MTKKRQWLISSVLMVGAVLVLQSTLGSASIGARSTRTGPIYSSSDAIRFAQDVLVSARLLHAGDFKPGRRDRSTIEALRTFQRRHYLRPTGLIDPETMGVLASHGITRVAAAPEEASVEVAERIDEAFETPPAIAEEVEEAESVALTADASESEIAEPEEPPPARSMPKTGSPTIMMLVLGGILCAAGSLLLIPRRA